MALGGMAIVGSLGMAAMMWPMTPAETPSVGQPAATARSSNATLLESSAAVMPDGSGPLPSPTLVVSPRSSAEVANPLVLATPSASVAVAPGSTASEGQLQVTSAPSGARVTVNGIGWGQTPLTIEHLPPGRKTVRVTKEGYASQERPVDIRSQRPAIALHVTLDSEAAR